MDFIYDKKTIKFSFIVEIKENHLDTLWTIKCLKITITRKEYDRMELFVFMEYFCFVIMFEFETTAQTF